MALGPREWTLEAATVGALSRAPPKGPTPSVMENPTTCLAARSRKTWETVPTCVPSAMLMTVSPRICLLFMGTGLLDSEYAPRSRGGNAMGWAPGCTFRGRHAHSAGCLDPA